MENDDLALGSLLGDGYEGNIKAGKYSKLSLDEVVDLFSKSEMADTFFPKDKQLIADFVNDNRKKDIYDQTDLLDLTRMFVKLNF